MAKFKNIIFDLGGVLFNVDYHLTRDRFIDLGVKNFDDLYSQADASDLFRRLEKGTIEVSEFYTRLTKLVQLPLTVEQINQAWNAMLLDFREDSLQYLSTLKDKANLLLLSNTNAIHKEAFLKTYHSKDRPFPFDDYFHHSIYSFETGTRKPDAECYRWVIDKAGIVPEETIFIDDSVQNIESAQSLGIHSILLKQGTHIEDLGLDEMI